MPGDELRSTGAGGRAQRRRCRWRVRRSASPPPAAPCARRLEGSPTRRRRRRDRRRRCRRRPVDARPRRRTDPDADGPAPRRHAAPPSTSPSSSTGRLSIASPGAVGPRLRRLRAHPHRAGRARPARARRRRCACSAATGRRCPSEGVTVPQLGAGRGRQPVRPVAGQGRSPRAATRRSCSPQRTVPTVPPTLTGTGAGPSDARGDRRRRASPPSCGSRPSRAAASDVLTLTVDGLALAPVRVSAQLDVSVGGAARHARRRDGLPQRLRLRERRGRRRRRPRLGIVITLDALVPARERQRQAGGPGAHGPAVADTARSSTCGTTSPSACTPSSSSASSSPARTSSCGTAGCPRQRAARMRERLIGFEHDQRLGSPRAADPHALPARRLGDHRRGRPRATPQRSRRDAVGAGPDRAAPADDRRGRRRSFRDVVLVRRRASRAPTSRASASRTSRDRR